MNGEFLTHSERETFGLGENFAKNAVSPGMCVLLSGGLGAGKTAFVRGVCAGLGIDEKIVRSPTFTLVNEYAGGDGKISVAHADLYRLEGNPTSVEQLFLNEYVEDGWLLLVEWAENGVFDFDCVKIEIEKIDENTRRFNFTSPFGG